MCVRFACVSVRACVRICICVLAGLRGVCMCMRGGDDDDDATSVRPLLLFSCFVRAARVYDVWCDVCLCVVCCCVGGVGGWRRHDTMVVDDRA
jgi:hypothetical protein